MSKLFTVIAEALGLPLAEVSDDLAYNSTPKWDSTAHMVLIEALEEAFDVLLDTDEIIDLSSVAKAREILRRHQLDV